MAEIINFNELKQKKEQKFIYNTWLSLPIVVRDNFKQGDIIIKQYHTDDKKNVIVNYLMPTFYEIKEMNKHYLNNLLVETQWTSMQTIENLINEHDCPDIS